MSIKAANVALNEKLLLSRREAAGLLGLSVNFLIQRERAGDLPEPIRVGRRVLHSRTALEEWARGNRGRRLEHETC